MRKEPLEHAQGLMDKASHDLIAAEATIATRQAYDMVCFHAQQAVTLTPFAVEARCVISFAPSADEARSALDTANQIFALVQRIIALR